MIFPDVNIEEWLKRYPDLKIFKRSCPHCNLDVETNQVFISKDYIINELNQIACSDGNCVFKVFPEQKKGMHTNGRCHCLDSLSYEQIRAIRFMNHTIGLLLSAK